MSLPKNINPNKSTSKYSNSLMLSMMMNTIECISSSLNGFRRRNESIEYTKLIKTFDEVKKFMSDNEYLAEYKERYAKKTANGKLLIVASGFHV